MATNDRSLIGCLALGLAVSASLSTLEPQGPPTPKRDVLARILGKNAFEKCGLPKLADDERSGLADAILGWQRTLARKSGATAAISYLTKKGGRFQAIEARGDVGLEHLITTDEIGRSWKLAAEHIPLWFPIRDLPRAAWCDCQALGGPTAIVIRGREFRLGPLAAWEPM